MSDNSNILAIDTSTSVLRLAVKFHGDRLVKAEESVERSHGQIIMKRIADLLQSAGVDKRELNAIGVCTGPGSFTGLRIGLAAAKGIATALRIPIVDASVFEIAAFGMYDRMETIRVVVPLRRDEFFVGEIKNGVFDGSISTYSVSEMPAIITEARVAGFGFDITERFAGLKFDDVTEIASFDGATLANLVSKKLDAGRTADIGSLEPLYVKKSQAEIRFDERN